MAERNIPNKTEFKPINPMNLPEEDALEWNRKHHELAEKNGAVVRRKGLNIFLTMVKNGELGIGSRIRVTNYGHIKDPHFVITSEGLVDALTQDEKILSPQEVFNANKTDADTLWEIVGFTPIFD